MMTKLGTRAFVAASMVGLLCSAAGAQVVGTSRTYRLLRASDIQEGCFAPCLCPISLGEDLKGRFRLTFAGNDSLFANYRVSDATIVAPQFSRTYTGGGTYRIGGEFALVQQMTLDLTSGGVEQRFDSGVVQATGPVPRWPRIDVTLARNNFFCFDTALHVVAAPVADWNGSGDVTVGDVFGFLEDYFAGEGDADGSGATSVEDIFEYIAVYFAEI